MEFGNILKRGGQGKLLETLIKDKEPGKMGGKGRGGNGEGLTTSEHREDS